MTTILILTNFASLTWATVYYIRYHWADDELQIARRALETNIQKLARSHQYQEQIRDFYQKAEDNKDA